MCKGPSRTARPPLPPLSAVTPGSLLSLKAIAPSLRVDFLPRNQLSCGTRRLGAIGGVAPALRTRIAGRMSASIRFAASRSVISGRDCSTPNRSCPTMPSRSPRLPPMTTTLLSFAYSVCFVDIQMPRRMPQQKGVTAANGVSAKAPSEIMLMKVQQPWSRKTCRMHAPHSYGRSGWPGSPAYAIGCRQRPTAPVADIAHPDGGATEPIARHSSSRLTASVSTMSVCEV
jgi:hypothetical protein